jgi:signal peptidase I
MATSTSRDLFADDDSLWEDEEYPSTGRSVIEWVAVVAGAVLVALLIKTFVVQAFFIPSESMERTLLRNDRVLVNKLSYRLHDVNRGDVVVFERPGNDIAETSPDIKDLIKRVVALPGEKVYFDDGGVYINDQLLKEPYLEPGTQTTPRPEGASYSWTHRCVVADPCVVPPDSVWVMGDYRANSQDSRYIGPIHKDLIVGRAFVIVWPFSRVSGL